MRCKALNKIFWINNGRVAGRCGPSIEPIDIEKMKAAGFDIIISLDAKEYSMLNAKNKGLAVKLFHLPNSIPPPPMEKKIFEHRLPETVEYLIKEVEENNKSVLVHCHAGNDRTGGVLTGYLSFTRKIPPTEALGIVREQNPQAISAPGYEEMIISILEAEYERL